VVGSAAQGGRAETKTASRQTGRRAMEGREEGKDLVSVFWGQR
jgi:hypothetical protein